MSSKNKKILPYSLAINEALHQMMAKDKSVFIIGQGVKSVWYVGNTCRGLLEKFGEARVIDTPVSENAVTGIGVGASLAGLKPVVIHPRLDFMMYAFDPIINEAANWHYMFGGKSSAGVVIRGIINRGGEQAAQHSQAIEALFAHIPGLKVVMPATAYDAKGLLISAIRDKNPVIYIEDRWLYQEKNQVPQKIYAVPIGKGVIRKKGKDITIAAISYMVPQAIKAAEELKKEGIEAEVIDLRTVKPLDIPLILKSVKKTKRLVITEAAWLTGGVAAEISAQISNKAFKYLKAPIERVCLPDAPAPMSKPLEKSYFINYNDIIKTIKKMIYV
ncbi:alpha-ketoacid dehydrogenase subunit beta [bacterium (Candidatus Moisslbacteria) CG12_big_fil_rev_8_21_14_0_65_36_11]|uniref:Alpha-ketoacid dehydrogenase subunit beta n=1 Tax=Candidatus Berkelbacteria bacterium CG23_combo_of_CG06-09_8_20_14_all_41_73 TaxID=1974519 RepID=A0A2H0B023_9BACT|nr:MAG: alpha-ketoacid dehydrogenase subunit beta [Candidatus Berkelbacteria bacterium CG23_combo_of_CG06-09_8_20_14_all_41_73]PIW67759.1 MAG: alpha-ketoacid dehydrogenase subunit beta [bacterium (Candidatus Moisslbacteria) CG12_big_fil_rev_8_21_14_0_65_36_11]PIZ90252.1 MAG: alpha-ketoacid dehydrogenase subunit beta [bacterium (Candidatus Moisslbacteria) CG_4_10_14_0_2_um_filter_36_61]